MTISQDEASRLLDKHYERICTAVSQAWDDYRKKYPHRTIHRRSTRANIVNDEILAKVIEQFDDVPETKFVEDKRKGLRFLRVGDKILLWFKKTNRQRQTRNYPTLASEELQKRGQHAMFPGLSVLVVGYLLNRDETGIVRVTICKPKGHAKKPEWYIDLEPVENNVAVMPGDHGHPRRSKVIVKKGAVQLELKS